MKNKTKINISLLTFFIFLNSFFISCAYDKNQVTKEQERYQTDENNEKLSRYSAVSGIYDGKLQLYQGLSDIRIILSSFLGKDQKPVMQARILTSDGAVYFDEVLSGVYNHTTGKMYLSSSVENSNSKKYINALEGFVNEAGEMTGSLFLNSGGKLGNLLNVIRTSTDNLVPGDGGKNPADDEAFKKIRQGLMEISGIYRGILRPKANDGLPLRVSLNLFLPFSDMNTLEGSLQLLDFQGLTTALSVTYQLPNLNMSSNQGGAQTVAWVIDAKVFVKKSGDKVSYVQMTGTAVNRTKGVPYSLELEKD